MGTFLFLLLSCGWDFKIDCSEKLEVYCNNINYNKIFNYNFHFSEIGFVFIS